MSLCFADPVSPSFARVNTAFLACSGVPSPVHKLRSFVCASSTTSLSSPGDADCCLSARREKSQAKSIVASIGSMVLKLTGPFDAGLVCEDATTGSI